MNGTQEIAASANFPAQLVSLATSIDGIETPDLLTSVSFGETSTVIAAT